MLIKIVRQRFSPPFNRHSVPWAYIFLTFVLLAFAVPFIMHPDLHTSDARDERSFHYPTVLFFLERFPQLDLVHYRSATTPLYHILLALSSFIVSDDIIPLRFVNLLFSLAVILLVYLYFTNRGAGIRLALYFTSLLMLSTYFIGPATRLLTDNLALFFALLAIYLLDTPHGIRKPWLICFVILCAIWTRQNYAWLIGSYLIICALRTWPVFGLHNELLQNGSLRMRSRRFLAASLPASVPTLGLGLFLVLWGGLTPPRVGVHAAIGENAEGLNVDAPVFIMALVGFYGLFFSAWLFRIYQSQHRNLLPVLVVIALSAGVLLLHPVSNEYPIVDKSLGDRGGVLWALAARTPQIFSTAALFWFLLPLGLLSFYTLGRYLLARRDYVVPVNFALWSLAMMISSRTYQKYYEPFILFIFGYGIVSIHLPPKKIGLDWAADIIGWLCGNFGYSIHLMRQP